MDCADDFVDDVGDAGRAHALVFCADARSEKMRDVARDASSGDGVVLPGNEGTVSPVGELARGGRGDTMTTRGFSLERARAGRSVETNATRSARAIFMAHSGGREGESGERDEGSAWRRRSVARLSGEASRANTSRSSPCERRASITYGLN